MLLPWYLSKIFLDMRLGDLEDALDIARDGGVTRNHHTLIEHLQLLDICIILDNEHWLAITRAPLHDEETKLGLTVSRTTSKHRHG